MNFWKLTLFICLSLSISGQAQELIESSTDQYPPNQQWSRIKTDHFDLIFPAENLGEGQRVAQTVETIYPMVWKTLKNPPKRFPLILSNQTVVPNGYVRLAPRMSEWYNTPPQDIFAGTNEWYRDLAIHEMRHMVQFDAFNQRAFRVMGYLFGDYGKAVMGGFHIPLWFWEGDAVGMETALSESGRGRMPSFDMHVRALVLEKKQPSYFEAMHRSYKNYYPNHYTLGYLLTTHAKRKYGADFWSTLAHRVSGGESLINPFLFSKSIKDQTNKRVKGLYNDAMNELDSLWTLQQKSLTLTPYHVVYKQAGTTWTNYRFPMYDAATGQVVALKSGLADFLQFVAIDSLQNERELFQTAPNDSYRYTIGNGQIAYTEEQADRRWGNRNYTQLKIYDLKTNKRRVLVSKTKYVMVAIAQDGKRVAAVEFSPQRICTVHILDATTGEVLQELPNPNNDYIRNVTWSSDGTQLAFTRLGLQGTAVSTQNIGTGILTDLIPYGTEDVNFLSFYKNYLLYNSFYSGIDNIYAIDTQNLQRYQVTSSRLGAFFPQADEATNTLYYSNYTIQGHELAQAPLKPETWKPRDSVQVHGVDYYQPLIGQESGQSVFKESALANQTQVASVQNLKDTSLYQAKPYKPFVSGMRLHSWGVLPLYPFLEATAIVSDLFNTTSLTSSVIYNTNERAFGYSLNASYHKWYPIFNLSANYQKQDQNTTHVFNTGLGIELPFNFSQGIQTTNLNFKADAINSFINERTEQYNAQYILANASLSHSIANSAQAVLPRYRQSLVLNYINSFLNGENRKVDYFSGQALLGFPSFIKNHTLTLTLSYDNQLNTRGYRSISQLLQVRSSNPLPSDTKQSLRLGLNYTSPIAFTDWSLGELGYIKRLNGNLFFDLLRFTTASDYRWQQRILFGIEVLAETHLFSLAAVPLNVGLRIVYSDDPQELNFLPIIGFSF